LQRLEHPLAVAHTHQHKISDAAHHLEPQPLTSSHEVGEARAIFSRRFFGEIAVVQRSQRRGLGDRVDVEGLLHAVQQGAHFRASVAIAHAEGGEAVNFRKRPQAD